MGVVVGSKGERTVAKLAVRADARVSWLGSVPADGRMSYFAKNALDIARPLYQQCEVRYPALRRYSHSIGHCASRIRHCLLLVCQFEVDLIGKYCPVVFCRKFNNSGAYRYFQHQLVEARFQNYETRTE